jgi:chromosome segregation ATPase
MTTETILTASDMLNGVILVLSSYIIWTLKQSATRWDNKADKETVERDYSTLKGALAANAEADKQLRDLVMELTRKVDIFVTAQEQRNKQLEGLSETFEDKRKSMHEIGNSLLKMDTRVERLEERMIDVLQNQKNHELRINELEKNQ